MEIQPAGVSRSLRRPSGRGADWRLRRSVAAYVYLHIDNDALDPIVAPGVVDDPVPGGLTMAAVRDVIRDVAARFGLPRPR